MSRARNIKPGFFRNEVLVELPYEYRLLFIGLWTHADREGRFEDRPTRIKMDLFPADDVDVDAGLQALHDKGFISRYSVDGVRYCLVVAWGKHQNPHHKEQGSTIPAPGIPEACPGQAADMPGSCPADSLIPSSLIPDSLFSDSKPLEQPAARSNAKRADRFEEFWAIYPVRKGKADALKTWTAKKLDDIADVIIADVKRRGVEDRQWLDGFAPHGSTYVNAKGWEDAIEAPRGMQSTKAGSHGSRPGAWVKPGIAATFKGTTYTGTAVEDLPPELREAVQRGEAIAAAAAAEEQRHS